MSTISSIKLPEGSTATRERAQRATLTIKTTISELAQVNIPSQQDAQTTSSRFGGALSTRDTGIRATRHTPLSAFSGSLTASDVANARLGNMSAQPIVRQQKLINRMENFLERLKEWSAEVEKNEAASGSTKAPPVPPDIYLTFTSIMAEINDQVEGEVREVYRQINERMENFSKLNELLGYLNAIPPNKDIDWTPDPTRRALVDLARSLGVIFPGRPGSYKWNADEVQAIIKAVMLVKENSQQLDKKTEIKLQFLLHRSKHYTEMQSTIGRLFFAILEHILGNMRIH